MAFAAPIAAFSATQKTVNKFNAVFRFGITPLFLFSGTFFPVESLPEVIRPIAWISPLYHGATLTRALSLGTAANDPVLALIHVVVLGACVVIGTWAAIRTIRRALVLG
jgi:lipooligosaccharide transport system permease protein